MNIGDRLRCRMCKYELVVTFEWLKKICAGKPGGAEKFREQLSKDLSRFRCTTCGSREVERLATEIPVRPPRKAHDPNRVNEGIAGTREDNKRMRARTWGEIVNRGK